MLSEDTARYLSLALSTLDSRVSTDLLCGFSVVSLQPLEPTIPLPPDAPINVRRCAFQLMKYTYQLFPLVALAV